MDESRIDWSSGTWAGSRREQLRQWKALPFKQKMQAMEELGDLARTSMLEKQRRGRPYFDPYTGQLVRPGT
jgi:hypothetical protein